MFTHASRSEDPEKNLMISPVVVAVTTPEDAPKYMYKPLLAVISVTVSPSNVTESTLVRATVVKVFVAEEKSEAVENANKAVTAGSL